MWGLPRNGSNWHAIHNEWECQQLRQESIRPYRFIEDISLDRIIICGNNIISIHDNSICPKNDKLNRSRENRNKNIEIKIEYKSDTYGINQFKEYISYIMINEYIYFSHIE